MLPKGGGSINATYIISFSNQKYFLKVNVAGKFPEMFDAEKKGLQFLSIPGCPYVPSVVFSGLCNEEQFLLIEFLQNMSETPSSEYELGEKLAILHRNSSNYFGLDHNNYIGSLKQANEPCRSWPEFFITRRLEPLLRTAIDRKELPSGIVNSFNSLFGKLGEIMPEEKPSLLHGDLWSGNKMNTPKGPAIFDPAVYYGHREADLSMTHMFGGFAEDFYKGYQDNFPLEMEWKRRIEIFNLYPLLVHLVLFGGGYAGDVIRIIRKF